MATDNDSNKSPVPELQKSSTAETTTNQQQRLQSSPNPTTPPAAAAAASDIPASSTTPTPTPTPAPATVVARPPEPTSNEADVIHIPSYSRWFSWSKIYEGEIRFLPEFFDGRSPSKNPSVYKYCRNSIIRRYRENPSRKITFTEVRKTIIGDVGSIRRVFDFLESWGLINYTGSGPSGSKLQLKLEDKESGKSNAAAPSPGGAGGTPTELAVPKKRLCSNCKSVCSIACFAADKHNLTLCPKCYVRGSFRVGVNFTDFKRVEIGEEIKTDWTDKETLLLLQAIMHYGDDWKKVAEHVGGKSERECVARFIKLPFGEQFAGPFDSADIDGNRYDDKGRSDTKSSPTKRMRLTPLADASNPIMAQAAFLSALVGVEVAEAAAQSALRALYEVNNLTSKESHESRGAEQQESIVASSGDATVSAREGAQSEAMLQLEKEEQDLQRSISSIAEVQAKEIQDKIVHFEESEAFAESDWLQLQQMRNLLFVDQLTLLFHKNVAPKTGESLEKIVKTES